MAANYCLKRAETLSGLPNPEQLAEFNLQPSIGECRNIKKQACQNDDFGVWQNSPKLFPPYWHLNLAR